MRAFVKGGFSSYKVTLRKTIKYMRAKTFMSKPHLKMKEMKIRTMGKLRKQSH